MDCYRDPRINNLNRDESIALCSGATREYSPVTCYHDNRIANLRAATARENGRNQGPHARSKLGLRGVCVRPNGRYRAQIHIDGKTTNIGTFLTLEEARTAYQSAALAAWGEFAPDAARSTPA